MDIKSYLYILKRNFWVVFSTVIVTVVVVTIITLMTTPVYTASTTLRIATSSSGVIGYSDYMYADRLMNTYIKLATSRPVLNELANKLSLQTIPPIKVELIPNTELIKISVESSDPFIAQNSSNSLAEIIIAQGKELYTGGGKSTLEILSEQLKLAEDELTQARLEADTIFSQQPGDPEQIATINQTIELKERTYSTLLEQYDQARLRETMRANIITVVEPAIQPRSPTKPKKVMNIGLGLLVGFVGGVGMAFLFENLGTRLHSSKQIEDVVELNLIGKIPPIERRRWFSLEKRSDEKLNGPFKEAIHRLQIQILLMKNPETKENNAFKTLLLTSAEPGEGKSTITSNLAMAIARSGQKVIVVDCDLRIPTLHKINGLPNTEGLSTLLRQHSNFEDVVQKTRYPGYHILTSGPTPSDPARMLGSSQMKSLVITLAHKYDMVLLDSPAFLAVADTALLATIVDGVLLIVRRNYTKEEHVREACKQLADIKAPVIGLVVNDAEPNGTYYYYRER